LTVSSNRDDGHRSYLTFYVTSVKDNGDPATEAATDTAAETSNWAIPSGTYGSTVQLHFTDYPNLYYNKGNSIYLHAAANPGNVPKQNSVIVTSADQVTLQYVTLKR